MRELMLLANTNVQHVLLHVRKTVESVLNKEQFEIPGEVARASELMRLC